MFRLDAAAFGFNSDGTVFGVDGVAIRALSVSAIAAALGLALDVFLLFMYIGADVQKFQVSSALVPYNLFLLIQCTLDARCRRLL